MNNEREKVKVRKKPVVVEAQYIPKDARPVKIRTPEGIMIAQPGDWIITGVEGERYPCKASVFQKTYELVEYADPAEPPAPSDRAAAENVATEISDNILKTSPGDRWDMMADKIQAALAAVRAPLVAAAREDNAALALCFDTFSRRITLDRRRECLLALQQVKADEVLFQEYDNDRKKVIAALVEVEE